MLWNRKQSKSFHRPCFGLSRQRTRVFSWCLSLLVGLSACFSLASDIDSASSVDFTIDEESLLPLAISLASSISPGTGNISNDVRSILDILYNSLNRGNLNSLRFRVDMDLIQGNYAVPFFNALFSERGNANGTSTPQQSYLYEIQRAIFGASGIPSASSDSVLGRLSSIQDALTNDQLRALLQTGFGSVTNRLSTVFDSLISGFYENNWYAANSYWKLLDIYSNLTSFVEYVDQSQNSNGSFFPGVGPHARVIDPVLFQVYETGRLMTTGEESTWLRVKDYDLLYELLQLNSALHALTDFSTNGIPSTNELANAYTLRRLLAEVEDFHGDYLSYTWLENDYWAQLLYDNLGYPSAGFRTLSTDMVDLENALFGNETAIGTNNILSVLKSISTTLNDTSDFSATATNELALTGQVMTNALNAIEASESNVTAYAENPDNEPPYDDDQYKYDGNPLEEFSSQFAGVPLQWTQLYRGAENAASTVTGIELYRGAFPIFGGSSGNRSLVQRSVNLPIYYELRDNEPAVAGVMNTTHDIMGWVWDVAAAFLIGWLYKRFAEYMSSQSLT